MRCTTLALFTLFGFATLTRLSQAQGVTVHLDAPDQIVALPTSGSVILDFIGTVSFDANTHYNSAEFTDALSASGESIHTTFGPLNFDDANNGGSVHGVLFTAQINSTTTPDLYQFAPAPGGPSFFSVIGTNAGGDTTASQTFSIRVAAIPETSTLLGLILLLGLGGTVHLRQSRLTRKTPKVPCH